MEGVGVQSMCGMPKRVSVATWVLCGSGRSTACRLPPAQFECLVCPPGEVLKYHYRFCLLLKDDEGAVLPVEVADEEAVCISANCDCSILLILF